MYEGEGLNITVHAYIMSDMYTSVYLSWHRTKKAFSMFVAYLYFRYFEPYGLRLHITAVALALSSLVLLF